MRDKVTPKFKIGDRVRAIAGYGGGAFDPRDNGPEYLQEYVITGINEYESGLRPNYILAGMRGSWDEMRFELVVDTLTPSRSDILAAYAAATTPETKRVLRKLYPSVLPPATRRVEREMRLIDMPPGTFFLSGMGDVFKRLGDPLGKECYYTRPDCMEVFTSSQPSRVRPVCTADGSIIYDTVEVED